MLPDLGLNTDDYNNVSCTAEVKDCIHTHTSQGTTVQLLCFLAMEFPAQVLIKRYGFKQILPLMMMGWGTVSWGQAFMTNKTGFYITRALIGIETTHGSM
jgi:hypothetical protein